MNMFVPAEDLSQFGIDHRYGLGFEEYAADELTIHGHLVGGAAHSAFIGFDQRNRAAVAVLMNTDTPGPQAFMALEALAASRRRMGRWADARRGIRGEGTQPVASEGNRRRGGRGRQGGDDRRRWITWKVRPRCGNNAEVGCDAVRRRAEAITIAALRAVSLGCPSSGRPEAS